jgi:hypothetical protein
MKSEETRDPFVPAEAAYKQPRITKRRGDRDHAAFLIEIVRHRLRLLPRYSALTETASKSSVDEYLSGFEPCRNKAQSRIEQSYIW